MHMIPTSIVSDTSSLFTNDENEAGTGCEGRPDGRVTTPPGAQVAKGLIDSQTQFDHITERLEDD